MKNGFFIISILLSGLIYGQAPNPNWINVVELPGEIVFLDTSNIKLLDNQISSLSLSVFKQPKSILSVQKEVKSIKSQILFNHISRNYTVIGTLYYDVNQRIIAENSTPAPTINGELFSLPVDSNKVMADLMQKCIEILNIESHPDSLQKNSGKEVVSRRLPPLVSPSESSSNNSDRNQQESIKGEPINQITEIRTPSKESTLKVTTEYNNANETNPRNMIFTDGNKYCFQVSSWKNKSKAESEVALLKRKGHNAFITDVNLPGRGLWYRVRIGYFNSLAETENYLSNFTE